MGKFVSVTAVVLLLAVVVIVLASVSEQEKRLAPAGATAIATTRAVAHDMDRRYFQVQLVEAHDASDRFGGDVAALGLNLRQLQALPIEDAFATVHEAALRIEDVAVRRRFLLELFDETEDR